PSSSAELSRLDCATPNSAVDRRSTSGLQSNDIPRRRKERHGKAAGADLEMVEALWLYSHRHIFIVDCLEVDVMQLGCLLHPEPAAIAGIDAHPHLLLQVSI